MSAESPLISIVVPAFNELATIETLIGRLQDALVGMRYEIVIVDDCSTDGTSDLIRKLSGGPDSHVLPQSQSRQRRGPADGVRAGSR